MTAHIDTTSAAALLADMVRIPSVTPRDGHAPAERDLAAFVAGRLERAGLEVAVEDVVDGRSNVVARLAGRDRSRTLLLESHMDTVEADAMTVDAFGAEVRGGRLYGRGSCDAKGCLAAFMLALEARVASGAAPPVDVALAAVMDEEHRHRGVLHLLEGGPPFAGAVVGEPTELRLVVAHKGCVRFEVRTLGRGAHTSQPADGDNAIRRMADVIRFVEDDMAADLAGAGHPLVGPPTICAVMVRGGAGINIVPPDCTLSIDRRVIPGEDPDRVFARCRAAIEALDPDRIEVLPPMVTAHALTPPPDGAEVVAALASALGAAGLEAAPCGVNYGSDASSIAAAGIPAVVFGPGTIADAHQPDESVELAQVAAAATVVADLIDRFGT